MYKYVLKVLQLFHKRLVNMAFTCGYEHRVKDIIMRIAHLGGFIWVIEYAERGIAQLGTWIFENNEFVYKYILKVLQLFHQILSNIAFRCGYVYRVKNIIMRIAHLGWFICLIE